jgi:hypothetical protein
MKEEAFDRKTLFLISNGNLPAVVNQRLYEYAWNQNIRPVMEHDLKPDLLVRKKRRGPSKAA